MNKLVRNEQKKLTAAFINGVAIALFGVGVLAQAAVMVQTTIVEPRVTLFVLICIPLAIALHFLGRAVLEDGRVTDLAYWGAMLIIPAGAVIVALAAFIGGRIMDARAATSQPDGVHHTPAE